MRIGIFDPYLDTLTGGERYILTTASCLSKKHQVFLFWDDESIIEKAKFRFPISLDTVTVQKNIFSPHVSFLERAIQARKYDVIFFLSDGSIPLSFAKKTIIHFQFPVQWLQKRSLMTNIKMKNIHKIVCNSEFTKKYIDNMFSLQSTVVYPPVSIYEASEKKENIITTVGRYSLLPNGEDFKKQQFLIEAFKKLYDNGLKDWKFVLVISHFDKDTQAVEKLRDSCSNYPIVIKSNIGQSEIENIYKTAKIYWHAAGYQEDEVEHPERFEHFGISTVEAMSAGAVPVVLNAGGQKEVVIDGENGFLWNTENELLGKTTQLIEKNNFQDYFPDRNMLADTFGEKRFCQEISGVIS